MSDDEDTSSPSTIRSVNFNVSFQCETDLDRDDFVYEVRRNLAEVVSGYTGESDADGRGHVTLNFCDVVPQHHLVTITIRAKGPDESAVRRAVREGISGLSWCNDVFSYTDQQIVSIAEVPHPGGLPSGGLGEHIRAIVGDPVPAGQLQTASTDDGEDDEDDEDEDDEYDDEDDEDLVLAGSVHDAEHDDPNRDQPF